MEGRWGGPQDPAGAPWPPSSSDAAHGYAGAHEAGPSPWGLRQDHHRFPSASGNGTGVSAGEIASFPQSSPPPFASDGLRRRAARVDTPDDADNDDSHPLSVLKRLDAFPKVKDEGSFQRSLSGGMLTVTALVLMVLLFLGELRRYLSVDTTHRLVVDTTRMEQLDITFDVTFPRAPCTWLTVDVMDSTGDAHMAPEGDVTKYRLDAKGNVIDVYGTNSKVGEKQGSGSTAGGANNLNSNSTTNSNPNGAIANANAGASGQGAMGPGGTPGCGSCYAAKSPTGCCNSCEDVINAYKAMGWAVNPRQFAQCQDPAYEAAIRAQRGEGCRVVGKVTTARIGGNLHIARGRSNYALGAHMHDLEVFPQDAVFDFSHVIGKVRFGDDFPGVSHPMDGAKHDAAGSPKGAQFQYSVKVVPTTYTTLNGKTIASNQISVTDHVKTQVDRSGFGSTLPGLFIFYELSPIKVMVEERRMGFLTFLTSVCAIVGGVFTVSGLIEGGIDKARGLMRKKTELGKLI